MVLKNKHAYGTTHSSPDSVTLKPNSCARYEGISDNSKKLIQFCDKLKGDVKILLGGVTIFKGDGTQCSAMWWESISYWAESTLTCVHAANSSVRVAGVVKNKHHGILRIDTF